MSQRLMDLTLAALALVMLAPLMAVIAVWIRLDSPGPALFRQVRVGRHGRTFRIHKFRTMRPAAPSEASETSAAAGHPAAMLHPSPLGITVAGDPRITRAGHFLRRHKLDELPQLLDVLRGAMSLVGPRPELPRYVAVYPKALRDRVLSVRPGLTDPASLAFADENERLARASDAEREYIEVVLPAKLALSARYVDERSLAGDLRLLVATLRRLIAVGSRRG
jgi:lipopolysaccharide/colanic/teichoic acid biosynthesis glycosyltransferase